MKTTNMTKMFAFIFLVIALSVFVSAETVRYVYTEASSDQLWINDSASNPTSIEIELPNTTMDLELVDGSLDFSITLIDMNVSQLPELNITARVINISNQNFAGSPMGTSSSSNYQAKYAYAFDIDQYTDRNYRVTFNYSSLGVSTPVLYKCDYNFSSGTTDFNCTELSYSTGNGLISATARNFSSFFLADDHTTTPVGGSSHGGGGGGGGDSGGGNILHVTPTVEGESIQVWDTDVIIVHYKEQEYHFRVTKVKSMTVILKDLATYYEHSINFGDDKRIGVTSFFAEDFYVSMHVTNNFALLTFSLPQDRHSLFNLLPPAPRTPRSAGDEVTGQQTTPTVTTPRPSPSAPVETPQDIQLPESPIDLWTILAGIAFVMLIVGGVALYRFKLSDLTQPPTVTGTGQTASGISNSAGAEPSQLLSSAETLDKPLIIEKPTVVEKPYMNITVEQKLELEKFVYHALSEGFNKEQVTDALLKKGWPRPNIEEIMKENSVGKAG